MVYNIDENIIGVYEMQNNYGTIIVFFFYRNIGLFSIAPFTVLTLDLLCFIRYKFFALFLIALYYVIALTIDRSTIIAFVIFGGVITVLRATQKRSHKSMT